MTKTKIPIIESRNISLDMLEPNVGQIKGVPANPRFLTDKDFRNLKNSIKNNPELLGCRELLVYPYNNSYVIIGGNSRYKALLDLGFTETPCKILDESLSKKSLKKYILLDNHSAGKWEQSLLGEGWSQLELDDIGLDIQLEPITSNMASNSSDEDFEDDDTREAKRIAKKYKL
jgi:hypothetical protein